METILASINPQWVHAIFSPVRKKRWEIRKKAPKEVPFRVLIYCTKGGNLALYKNPNDGEFFLDKHGWSGGDYEDRYLSGKVVGEFICDKVYKILNQGCSFSIAGKDMAVTNTVARESCLDFNQMRSYFGDKGGYAWHISKLKIYDKPKELSEFKKPSKCPENIDCCACKHWNSDAKDCGEDLRLKRPPQSWCYVEEKE